MRRISVLLFVLLLLCSCAKSEEDLLKELGYTEADIAQIETLSEETRKRFLEEKQEQMLLFIRDEEFREENLDKYLELAGEFDESFIIRKVNEGIMNKDNAAKLKELYSSEYYIDKKEELYLKYLDKYDTVRDVIERVNTKRYLELYSNIETTDVSKDYLLLVNKYYQLPSDYEPDDLVAVSEVPGRGYLRKAVYEAYKELYEDAQKLGYNLNCVSAYRPYSMQESLYASYLKVDPQEVVDTYSARAGHSEHQSGLCLDVSIPGYSLDNFYKTEASKWLAENCYKYGFIIRYPDDKTDITGYQGEPWQLRYLGKEVSEDVFKRGITYDEYYACFVE
ncbi:MAG: M15 family metallopeptidase [Erysipelotrichaceae bacterium]|nr:M15 family metallopeptidase [Erysipelotrichaceae bacterium]